jgi:MFS family permease
MSPRVKRIIISHGLTGFICWYGIEKVFQKSIGISVLEVSILAIIYIAISAALNVPTGILADKKGRRYAIVLAACALLASTLVAGVAQNIWQYLISIILWGFFYTTQNGAYEAMLYDTLKEEGNEKEYARYSGLSIAAFFGAIFISSVIGAWVGSHLNLRLAYFITRFPNIFNIFLALSLHEPKRQKHDPTTNSFTMARQGFKFLKSSPQVLQLAGTFLLINMLSWTTNEFGQLFFIELGIGVFLVGILNAFSGLFQAIGSSIGHRFSNIPVRMATILVMILFTVIFLLPTNFRALAISLFLVFVILRQIFYISTDAALQHSLPSNIRATTLSSLGMLNDGILVICYLGFGLVSQHKNVRSGYLVIGFFGVLLILVTWLLSRNLKAKELLNYTIPLGEKSADTGSIPH